MVTFLAVAMFALLVSIGAVEFFSAFLRPQPGRYRNTPAQTIWILLPLVAMVALLAAVVSIYRHLSRHHGATRAAAGGRSSTELASGVACAAVGLLLIHDGDVAQSPRAIGAAAAHVLPTASTATFFLGIALVFAHVGAGAGGEPVQATPLRILTKVTLGAAAGVAGLMALAALYTEY